MGKVNYFNYFTEIESFFLKKRKKGLLLSPLDWTLIETWKEMGIPLHIVLRGIEKSFVSFEKKRKNFSNINSLYYCNQSVMEEFEKFILASQGENLLEEEGLSYGEDVSIEEKLNLFLTNQIEVLSSIKEEDEFGELFNRVKFRINSLMEEIKGKNEIDMDKLEGSLREIDELIVKYLEKNSTPEFLREIRREVNREIRKYRNELPKKMFENIKRKQFQKKLKEKYGLKNFSILELL